MTGATHSDPLESLRAALADRYRLERELGQGGMATAYLAQDLKHHHPALKVLRPELAATLGPERFLGEIEIAAQLHHPLILPLYDSGEAGGFLLSRVPADGCARRARRLRAWAGADVAVETALHVHLVRRR